MDTKAQAEADHRAMQLRVAYIINNIDELESQEQMVQPKRSEFFQMLAAIKRDKVKSIAEAKRAFEK